jgi:hypothetical protein
VVCVIECDLIILVNFIVIRSVPTYQHFVSFSSYLIILCWWTCYNRTTNDITILTGRDCAFDMPKPFLVEPYG